MQNDSTRRRWLLEQHAQRRYEDPEQFARRVAAERGRRFGQ